MKLKSLIVLPLLVLLVGALQAQDYNVVMPGQKKVTKTDEQGNQTTQIVTDDDSDYIQFRGDSWFYKGQTMTGEEFVAKMKAECTPAYEKFMRSAKVKKTGITMAIVGGAAMLAGAGFMIGGAVTADHINYYNSSGWYVGSKMVPNWAMFTGISLLIAGGGVFIGGMVVTLQTAPDCKRKAHQIYNRECASHAEPTIALNLGLSQDGLGFVMNF